MPGFSELIVIGAIIFLLFGGKIMSHFFKSLGETVRELKQIKKEL